jgi:phosphohistidine phosphatase
VLQAGVVPFRGRGAEAEVCLITSLKRRHWIFPKGIVDPGDSFKATALKEAAEEAGLEGRLIGQPLGSYEDFKWNRVLKVTMLLMETTACDDEWAEDDVRDRCWVRPARAMHMISKPQLRGMLKVAIGRLGLDLSHSDGHGVRLPA